MSCRSTVVAEERLVKGSVAETVGRTVVEVVVAAAGNRWVEDRVAAGAAADSCFAEGSLSVGAPAAAAVADIVAHSAGGIRYIAVGAVAGAAVAVGLGSRCIAAVDLQHSQSVVERSQAVVGHIGYAH